MRILLTGIAGFIGSNFLYYMIDKYPNYEIIGVDFLTYAGNLDTINNALQNENFTFIKADISDRSTMQNIFEKYSPIDVVVNFAAESHVDRSIEEPTIFLQTNIIGTQILLDMVKTYDVRRFHQVSTDEVYGDLPLNSTEMFTEKTPIKGSSPYAASKASADLLVQAYFRTYDLPVTLSRCSNNYGPYQFPEKLIPLVIHRALENSPIPVYGTGENVRDWLYVEDHCAAIDLIIHKGAIGEVYNIGGHNERSNLYVVQSILALLDKPESLISFVEDRLGHDMRYAIDPTKIANELGWLPTITFEEGLRKTVKWYLSNEEWYNKVLSGEYRESSLYRKYLK